MIHYNSEAKEEKLDNALKNGDYPLPNIWKFLNAIST